MRLAARTALILVCVLSTVVLTQAPPAPRARAGILVLDLTTGQAITSIRPDVLSTRLAPGAVLKVATLIAALEYGIINPSTTFACHGRVNAADRQLVCVHPDLHRPLTPADALALSCNDFFVTIGSRLLRQSLSATTTAMGLPAISSSAPVPLAAVGLAGMEVTPEVLLKAFARVVDPAGMRMSQPTREVVMQGLKGAVQYGTAQALSQAGVDALAMTATASTATGSYHGLAVALSPSDHPTRAVVVLVPGGSAGDAAVIAADALKQAGATVGAAGDFSPANRQAVQGAAAPGSGLAPGRIVRVGQIRPGGGYEIVEVPLEEYVARVIAGEASPRSSRALLEALAIAIRTFAVANLGRHAADGFDLCNQTHCQVMATATPATRAAADATAGQVLFYKGQVASIFYTASCGGVSELPGDVWPRATNPGFLARHSDPKCKGESAWSCEIADADLRRALVTAGFKGDELSDLKIARKSASGRASLLRLEGLTPQEISGDSLRLAVGRTLGWNLIKSTLFSIKRTDSGFRFIGHGSGHGVGLCVQGATRMAADGKDAREILASYFPGTSVVR